MIFVVQDYFTPLPQKDRQSYLCCLTIERWFTFVYEVYSLFLINFLYFFTAYNVYWNTFSTYIYISLIWPINLYSKLILEALKNIVNCAVYKFYHNSVLSSYYFLVCVNFWVG